MILFWFESNPPKNKGQTDKCCRCILVITIILHYNEKTLGIDKMPVLFQCTEYRTALDI